MKKRYIVLFSIILVVLLGIFIIPVIFKDDLQRLLTRKLNENLNATVYFDNESFEVSLIKSFPNLMVDIGDLGVIGKADFEGDTLAHIDHLGVVVDIKSVIFGDKVQVKGVSLDKPRLMVKVLPDGKANYDIAKPSEESAPENDGSAGALSVGIQEWSVSDGFISYNDQSLAFAMRMEKLQHSGTGDFALDVFDMDTQTEAGALTVSYDGVEYLSKTKAIVGLKMGMDFANGKYTFKENDIHLNDFGMSLTGYLTYLAEEMDLHFQFASKENTFKSLLSLMPAIYSKDFEKLETSGSVMFEGEAKGKYNETTMPGFRVELTVANGQFHYPGLPDEVKDVKVSAKVSADEGADYESLKVEVPAFGLQMGPNPIKGSLSMQGLSKYKLKADVDAKVNLQEFGKIYPIEGLEMKGLFSMNLNADGTYDEAKGTMPKVEARMMLENGYVKSADYPIPAEQITFKGTATSTTGQLKDFQMSIAQASMQMDGKPLSATGNLSNLDDPTYDLALKGEIDLGILDKVYPIEGMSLSGRIVADVATRGKMSAIEAKKYDQLPTKGSLLIENLAYADKDLPQGVKITKSEITFSPQDIVLKNYEGFLGKSDIKMQGKLFNYLGYALKEDETLFGSLEVQSKLFDSNEWMVDESGNAVEEGSGEYGVVALPENINFKMGVKADKALYEKFEIKQVSGVMHLRDGILAINDLLFSMYGGSFGLSGLYDPRDLKNPLFDFSLSIKDLPFAKAYQEFASVKAMAPIAKAIEGLFSTNFKLSGKLGSDLMPIPESLNGNGLISIIDAQFNGEGKIMDKVQTVSGLEVFDKASINDFKAEAKMENGKLSLRPKPFKLGGYKTNLAGTVGLDGGLDFNMQVDLPGNQLPSNLSGIATKLAASDTIPLNFRIGGSYSRPVVGLDTDAIKSQVKARIKGEVTKATDKAKEEAKEAVTNTLKDQAGKLLGTQDTTKKDSTATTPTVKDKVEESKDKLKDLKDKLPFGKKKKDGGN